MKMLSTNSTSAVQKRHQRHRRQQTLEVPILAPHHPANPRRNQAAAAARNAQQQHRRGLSLDQSLSVVNSPVAFRQLGEQEEFQPQDQDHHRQQRPGSSPVRIHLDTNPTNKDQQQQQHFIMQETQQQSLAQPGFQAQDFQSHLQQQLQQGQQLTGTATATHVAAPTPTQPSQQMALEQLQHHVEWYNKNFGQPAEQQQQQPNMPFDFSAAASTSAAAAAAAAAFAQAQQSMQHQQQQQQHPMPHGIPPQAGTPVSMGQPRTVPNTPQQYQGQAWPSPPPTNAKHVRSQSFQYEAAAAGPMQMPVTVSAGQVMKIESSPAAYIEPMASFSNSQDAFNNLTSDPGYASSTYTASIADPMSPGRSMAATHPMPTVFEEAMDSLVMQQADELLLQAGHAPSDDFSSPHFMMGSANDLGLSPKDNLLEGLGPNVNATIIDTGVPVDEIDRYISEQHPVTKLYYCLWNDDGNSEQCDKWHKRKENARSHVQGHLGDRQFLCNDCGKTFVRQHDMKRHAAIHNPERPHRCPCGSRFARHDALTRHRQRGMCKGALPGFERSEEDKPKRGRPKKKDRPDREARTSKAQRARKMDREKAAAAAAAAEEEAQDDEAAGDSAVGVYHSSSSVASERGLPMTPPDTSDFDTDAFINLSAEAVAGGEAHFNVAPMPPAAWNDTPPTSPMPVMRGSAGTSASGKMQQLEIGPDFVAHNGISPAMLQASSPVLTHSSALPHSSDFSSHPSPAHSHHAVEECSSPPFNGASSPLDAYSHGAAGSFGDADFNFGVVDTQPDVAGAAQQVGGACPPSDFFSDAFSPTESSGGSDFGRHPYGTMGFDDEEDEELFGGRPSRKEFADFGMPSGGEREVSAGFWALEQFVSSH